MALLGLASLRHLARHPAQLALALVGLSIGVATIVAVDLATASSQRAFQLSMQAVRGASTHEIDAGPHGVDESFYVRLRTTEDTSARARVALAPVVEGYVTIADRTMQLVGIDPLASLEINDGQGELARLFDRYRVAADGRGRGDRSAAMSPTRWLTQPGAVVMSASAARQLGLALNRIFTLELDGKSLSAILIGVIEREDAGYDALILTDIAQAQEWLGLSGRLTRIDVRVPDGPQGAVAVQWLRARLPPGMQILEAQRRTRQSLDMTAAFTTNLRAMSLLALLVSTLLIYGAVSFAVVQRRRIVGILRALGATRGEVLTLVLSEAAVLGVIGSGLGLLLGMLIGRGLIQLVSRTINDLYFVVAVNQTVLPPATVAKALLAGLGTALVGALLPALEVAGSVPQLALRRSALEARARSIARELSYASGGFAVAAGVVVLVSGRSLLAGFVGWFVLLCAVAAATPALLQGLARMAARLVAGTSTIARLACSDIAASVSRTGVAVAALGMAIAAMIGVSIMVESFRESLRDWLAQTLRADIYVTAPGPGAGRPERQIDPVLTKQLLALPEVLDYGMSRHVVVDLPGGPISLDAVQLARGGYANIALTEGDPAVTWPAFERGAVIVSEPLAWRLQLHLGGELSLPTDTGSQVLRVAGIYREYGNEHGSVMMALPVYRGLWRDRNVTAIGIYVSPRTSLERCMSRILALARGRQSLLVRSNAELRDFSMAIFERTFIITRVLYWLAAGVAAVGLVSSLLAWELERAREMAILRAIGLSPRGAAVLIEAQTGFMGLVALLAAIPTGLLTALLLTDVINRRAFGWRIEVHLTGAQFGNALLLAIAAALAAGLYPAWRVARARIATDIREE